MYVDSFESNFVAKLCNCSLALVIDQGAVLNTWPPPTPSSGVHRVTSSHLGPSRPRSVSAGPLLSAGSASGQAVVAKYGAGAAGAGAGQQQQQQQQVLVAPFGYSPFADPQQQRQPVYQQQQIQPPRQRSFSDQSPRLPLHHSLSASSVPQHFVPSVPFQPVVTSSQPLLSLPPPARQHHHHQQLLQLQHSAQQQQRMVPSPVPVHAQGGGALPLPFQPMQPMQQQPMQVRATQQQPQQQAAMAWPQQQQQQQQPSVRIQSTLSASAPLFTIAEQHQTQPTQKPASPQAAAPVEQPPASAKPSTSGAAEDRSSGSSGLFDDHDRYKFQPKTPRASPVTVSSAEQQQQQQQSAMMLPMPEQHTMSQMQPQLPPTPPLQMPKVMPFSSTAFHQLRPGQDVIREQLQVSPWICLLFWF